MTKCSVQKRSDSEQVPWTAFFMKMGKHGELKDKQISSQCISFTAAYMFMEMKTSCPRTVISLFKCQRNCDSIWVLAPNMHDAEKVEKPDVVINITI